MNRVKDDFKCTTCGEMIAAKNAVMHHNCLPNPAEPKGECICDAINARHCPVHNEPEPSAREWCLLFRDGKGVVAVEVKDWDDFKFSDNVTPEVRIQVFIESRNRTVEKIKALEAQLLITNEISTRLAGELAENKSKSESRELKRLENLIERGKSVGLSCPPIDTRTVAMNPSDSECARDIYKNGG